MNKSEGLAFLCSETLYSKTLKDQNIKLEFLAGWNTRYKIIKFIKKHGSYRVENDDDKGTQWTGTNTLTWLSGWRKLRLLTFSFKSWQGWAKVSSKINPNWGLSILSRIGHKYLEHVPGNALHLHQYLLKHKRSRFKGSPCPSKLGPNCRYG